MIEDKIQVGDISAEIIMTFLDKEGKALNIYGASEKKITLQKPNGTTIEKEAEYCTDGEDGKLKYVTAKDDIDQEGLWHKQGFVVLHGQRIHCPVEEFVVYSNL